jgi:hypothetical protein
MAVVYRRQQELVLVFYYQESLFDDDVVQDIHCVAMKYKAKRSPIEDKHLLQ